MAIEHRATCGVEKTSPKNLFKDFLQAIIWADERIRKKQDQHLYYIYLLKKNFNLDLSNITFFLL